MKISFNPPRARIVAVVLFLYMLWLFVDKHLGTVIFNVSVFDQLHALGALAIIGIIVVGLRRLSRHGP